MSGTTAVRDERQLAIESIVQRARAAGADAQGMTWDGEAGESIVDVAEAESADLIVVGTHGRGAPSGGSSWAASRTTWCATRAAR